MVVENRGGANGQIAVQALANAPPDGYTLLSVTGTTLSVNPSLYPKSADVTLNRIVPITRFVQQDFMISVRSSLGVSSLKDLIEWSKKNPGRLNVSTTAIGSLAYMTAQLFKDATGMDFVTVPHNGGSVALGAVLGGHADVLVETVSLTRPYVEAGTLTSIAITGPTRSTFLPSVPTLKELNVDVETSGWTALVAPKNTPAPIVRRIHAVLADALKETDLRKVIEAKSSEAVVNTPEAFEREWRREVDLWARLIKRGGLAAQ